MDLNRNLLWCLGSYNTALIHFSELLQDKKLAVVHDELWRIVIEWIEIQREHLLQDAGQAVQPKLPPEAWQQLRDVYSGRYKDYRRAVWMLMYAQALALHSSYGDAPWRRVSRLVEQHYEEWRTLELEKSAGV